MMRASAPRVAIQVLATLLWTTVLWTAAARAIETGPEVGEKIPVFEARDQTGTLRTFEELCGPEGLLLLFYRTADW